jgi:hypothetical protein
MLFRALLQKGYRADLAINLACLAAFIFGVTAVFLRRGPVTGLMNLTITSLLAAAVTFWAYRSATRTNNASQFSLGVVLAPMSGMVISAGTIEDGLGSTLFNYGSIAVLGLLTALTLRFLARRSAAATRELAQRRFGHYAELLEAHDGLRELPGPEGQLNFAMVKFAGQTIAASYHQGTITRSTVGDSAQILAEALWQQTQTEVREPRHRSLKTMLVLKFKYPAPKEV